MDISNVVIHKIIQDGTKQRAIASICLDNEIVIRDLVLIEGAGRWFVSFPGKRRSKDNKNDYADVVYPRTKNGRQKIEDAIKKAYDEALKKSGASGPTNIQ